MARVKGPLMSVEASGNATGACMQFRTVNGRTHVYRPPEPDNQNQAPPTPEQEAVRLRFKAACNLWAALPMAQKSAYSQRANAMNISGYSLFMREHLGLGSAP